MSDAVSRRSTNQMQSGRRREREAAQQRVDVRDQVRLACMKVDGAVALGGHIMQRVVALDELRLTLSQGDPVTSALLSDIEANTVRQAKSLQHGLYDELGI